MIIKIERWGPKDHQNFNFFSSVNKSDMIFKLGSKKDYTSNYENCKFHKSGSSNEGGKAQEVLASTAVDSARFHLS